MSGEHEEILRLSRETLSEVLNTQRPVDRALAPRLEALREPETRRLQRLVMGALRFGLFVDRCLVELAPRPPKRDLRSLVWLAGYELIGSAGDRDAKIVHGIVEYAKTHHSPAEARFLNAVLRKLPEVLSRRIEDRARWSHPDWMVARWEREFGVSATRLLMDHNLEVPPVYAFSELGEHEVPEAWTPTQWPGYFDLSGETQNELRESLQGHFHYIQDPFAMRPIELLSPRPGERILDLCAAPGGKSWHIARLLRGDKDSLLVAVDSSELRLEKLHQNLGGAEIPIVVHRSEVEDLASIENMEAGTFDGVLIDVPCSNTGVLRRRPDVKLRLTAEDIDRQAAQQLQLLEGACRWVRLGGRLVYSTCSLEREENEAVVEAFLRKHPEFKLEASKRSRPWLDGHDGGGAFLLTLGDRQE